MLLTVTEIRVLLEALKDKYTDGFGYSDKTDLGVSIGALQMKLSIMMEAKHKSEIRANRS